MRVVIQQRDIVSERKQAQCHLCHFGVYLRLGLCQIALSISPPIVLAQAGGSVGLRLTVRFIFELLQTPLVHFAPDVCLQRFRRDEVPRALYAREITTA